MESLEKIQIGVQLMAEGFGDILKDIANNIAKTCKKITENLNPILKKKITKKKFCKLLQSYNIQRNEINKIIKDNKRPYNYSFLYEIVNARGN
ncbi:hypothetical protein IJD44_07825 [bacterium]|nr:hypothetical protein [bacterium]